MLPKLDFKNKTVLITGSTRGIGYGLAEHFASLGANLVINGTNADLVTKAVAALQNEGARVAGIALPVTRGEDIVAFALNAFQRVDVVINNAGIVRDSQFHNMSLEAWDEVYRVHLEGAFRITRAMWPHFMSSGGGRILMISSDAGLFGNFGQSNYSAMKAGMIGFTKALAIEGKRYDIKVNAICPAANTDMTEALMKPVLKTHFTIDRISPVAAYLCHGFCSDSGSVVSAGAGLIAKGRYQYNEVMIEDGQSFSIDDVHRVWTEISGFETNLSYPTKLSSLYNRLVAAIEAGRTRS